jgi:hypothetical protein
MKLRAPSRPVWTLLIAAPVILAAVAAVQVRIDTWSRSLQNRKDELFLRSGKTLKEASFGYDALLADIYWTRAVQYFGSRSAKQGEHLDLLDPLLNITTTLDPRLLIAYRFGAIFLSEPAPLGAARPDLAVNLVKKGIAANPSEWQLYSDLAFIYYWHLNDYANASAAYLEGSKIPNAPEYMKIMAARVSEKGGSLDNSLSIWEQIYQSATNPKMKQHAQEYIVGLTAQRDEQELDRLADEYHQRFGRYPDSMKELVDAGLIRGIPLDPVGYPYIFGADGQSKLDPASPVVIPAPTKVLGR